MKIIHQLIAILVLGTVSCPSNGDPRLKPDSDKIASFPKCCPDLQVWSLTKDRCQDDKNDSLIITDITNHLTFLHELPEEWKVEINYEQELRCNSDREEIRSFISAENQLDFVLDMSASVKQVYSIGDNEVLETFCLDLTSGQDKAVARACSLTIKERCKDNKCVRNCCPFGHGYDPTTDTCQQLDPALVQDHPEDLEVIYQPLECNRTVQIGMDDMKLNLTSGFHLEYSGQSFDHNDFCISRIFDHNRSNVIFLCHPGEVEEEPIPVDYGILKYCYIASMVFLVLSLVVIHNKINKDWLFSTLTKCMIVTLFLFYTFYTVTLFAGSDFPHHRPLMCMIQGFAIQFCYLSTLCWLNTMCFKVWNSMRSIKHLSDSSRAGAKYRRDEFLVSCLYALVLPLTMTLLTLVAHLHFGDSDHWLHPKMGQDRCFIHDKAMFVYVYPFSGFTTFWNLLGFCSIIKDFYFGIWSVGIERVQVTTVIKMFVILGLSWTFDLILWVLDELIAPSFAYHTVSLVFDIINGLQGLFIFLALLIDAPRLAQIKLWCRRPKREAPFQARYRRRINSWSEECSIDATTNSTITAMDSDSRIKQTVSTLTSPMRKTYLYHVTDDQ